MGGAYPTGQHRLAICPGHLGNLLKRAARPDCGGFERLPGKPEPPANQPIAQFKAALNPNRMATCTITLYWLSSLHHQGAHDKFKMPSRSEESRVGKEFVSTCKSRGSPVP